MNRKKSKEVLQQYFSRLRKMISEAIQYSDDAAFLIDDMFEFDSLELESGSPYHVMKIILNLCPIIGLIETFSRNVKLFKNMKSSKFIRYTCEGSLFDVDGLAEIHKERNDDDSKDNEMKESEYYSVMKSTLFADIQRLGQLIRRILRYATELTVNSQEIAVKGYENRFQKKIF
jgi:hypothetical protein